MIQLLDENRKLLLSVDSPREFSKEEVEDFVCRVRKLLAGEKLEIVKYEETFKIKNKAVRLLWLLAGLPQIHSQDTCYLVCFIRFSGIGIFKLN